MGLFDKLFGKKKKETAAESIDKKALGLKHDAEVVGEKAPKQAPKKTPAAEKAKDTAPVKTAGADVTDAPKEAEAPKEKASNMPSAKETDRSRTAIDTQKQKAPQAPAPAEEMSEEKDNTVGGGRFEIKKTKDGRFVFNLYAKNHVIVATSQIYSSSAAAVNGIKSIIANAPIAAVEDQTLKNWQPQGFPKWEIYEDKGAQYRFRLSAPNGSCICHSQGYTNKVNCKNGIQSIIRSVKDASVDKAYLKKIDD